jgi:hypothetical protein
VNAIFKDSHSVFGSMFSQDVAESWHQRFADFSQAQADANLPQSLLLPRHQTTQSSTFQMPAVCQLPTTSQLPAPVEHSQYVLENQGKFTVAGLQKMLTDYKKTAKAARNAAQAEGGASAEGGVSAARASAVAEQVVECDFSEVVGVWRDHETGEKLVAMIWDENDREGGTWIEFDDLLLGVAPAEIERGTEDSDDEDAFEISDAAKAANGDTVRWHDAFGSGLQEGTKLVVQWVETTSKGSVFKNYLGELSGDYDPSTASHHLAYERCVANASLHTLGNPNYDEHWMNLASLEVDKDDDASGTPDEFFSFWVKASAAHLGFITEHLFEPNPSPTEETQKHAQKRKRDGASERTSDDVGEKANSSARAPAKNMTRAQKQKAKMMKEVGDLM